MILLWYADLTLVIIGQDLLRHLLDWFDPVQYFFGTLGLLPPNTFLVSFFEIILNNLFLGLSCLHYLIHFLQTHSYLRLKVKA